MIKFEEKIMEELKQTITKEEETKTNKPNLIARACNRMKLLFSKPKIKKRIAAIALATSVIVGAGALTACNNNPSIDPNPTPTPTPGPTTEYSQILNDVLDSDYYADLTDSYRDAWSYPITKAHEAIPYAFLSREGYDIQAIKDEEIDCDSVAYIKNNDTNTLYLSTRVETNGADPYYTCYTLRYSLTDDEYDDLVMLHEGKYIQAPYFIQELDNQKTAHVESKASITVEVYDELEQSLINNKNFSSSVFGTDKITLDFLNFSVKNNTFDINVRETPDRGNNTSTMVMIVPNAQLRSLHLFPASNRDISTINNSSVFNGPGYYWDLTDDEITRYKNNYDTITYFDSSSMYNLHLGEDLVEEK